VEYKELLMECVRRIDNDIIMMQKYLSFDTKMYCISQKYTKDEFVNVSFNNVYYGKDAEINHAFSRNSVALHFLKVEKDDVVLSLRESVVKPDVDLQSIFVK
jgi:hypothetical protein